MKKWKILWVAVVLFSFSVLATFVIVSSFLISYTSFKEDSFVLLKAGIMQDTENGAYETHTTLDIFSFEKTEEKDIKIISCAGVSDDGTALIAPGSRGFIPFIILNESDTTREYVMNISVTVSNSNYELPLEINLMRQDKKFIIGDGVDYVKINTINEASDIYQLGANYYSKYSLAAHQGDDT